MPVVRNASAVALALAAVFVLAACGESKSVAGAETVKVGISDAGCSPAELKLKSGPKNFEVAATGSGKVTEFEILDGTRILGERENLTPGLTGKFSLNLPAGEYTSYCPNGTNERGKVIVTDAGGSSTAEAASPSLQKATAGYAKYVNSQADELVKRTGQFVAAVKAGDVKKAKSLFAHAREPWESIEPVAESFGDLDPIIDARENDVAKGDEWTGFHRIEKALWVKNSTKGMNSIADKLLVDVKDLQSRAKDLEYQPAQLANGASELLDEVSQSKITGEEDRYSHTDLWDFAANVDGSQKAYKLLRPALVKKDAKLADAIDDGFARVGSDLADYRRGDGFVYYDKLTKADTRKLSQAIDALAEPLSKVSALVVS